MNPPNITWPFHDETSGYDLKENLYYGFGDSGSMYCANFPSKEGAIAYIKIHHEMKVEEIGTEPGQLSEYAVVVMSGSEFVEECFKRGLIDENGVWTF